MSVASLLSVATVVEVSELAQTALAALLAGVGVTFTFSIAILGFARYAELHREGRESAALGAGLLAVGGLAASAAAVVFGIAVMVNG